MDDPNTTVQNRFSCTFCKKTFSSYFNLKRHLKSIHKEEEMLEDRGRNLIEFNNFSEFMTWKEQEEKDTESLYVKHRGESIRKNGDKIIYYHCNRSGIYKSKGKGVKKIKSQGSSKIGTTCPAKIRLKLTRKKILVHYFSKHENHEAELNHLRISNSDRIAIAGKLIEGVTKNEILSDVRNNIINIDSRRKLLMDKKYINNIKRDFNIDGLQSHHKTNVKVKNEGVTSDSEEEFLKKCDKHSSSVSSSITSVNTTIRTKLQSILAVIDEIKLTSEQSNMVHKNLNNILNICNEGAKKQKGLFFLLVE